MPLGSGYARGYSLGQNDRRLDMAEEQTAFSNLRSLGGGRPMGGNISVGRSSSGAPDASEIRARAIENALKQKADEVAREKEELALERMRMENEGMEYGLNRKRLEDKMGDAERAEERADKMRAGTQADETRQKASMLENAVRSVYMGDSEGFKQFFDVYGAPNVTVHGLQKTPQGQVIVNFGEGKSETFQGPRDVIDKLLKPAAALTEQDSITPNQEATIRNRAYRLWQDEGNIGVPTEEDLAPYIKMLSPQSEQQGLNYGQQTETPPAPGMGNKQRGRIDKGPTKNFAEYKDPKTGETIRKALSGKEYVRSYGRWVPRGQDAPEKTRTREQGLKQDLMKNGHTEQQAEKYIQDARKKGLI